MPKAVAPTTALSVHAVLAFGVHAARRAAGVLEPAASACVFVGTSEAALGVTPAALRVKGALATRFAGAVVVAGEGRHLHARREDFFRVEFEKVHLVCVWVEVADLEVVDLINDIVLEVEAPVEEREFAEHKSICAARCLSVWF